MIRIGARRQPRARIQKVILRELFYSISEQVLHRYLSVPLISTGNSSDSSPLKTASDEVEMQ